MADYLPGLINLKNGEQNKGVDLLTMGEEVIGWPEDKVRTGPPAPLRGYGAAPASVALHRGSPRPGDERLAETEGFEPSIGLYNPITV